MAKKSNDDQDIQSDASSSSVALVKVRVLRDCSYGNCDDVVEVDSSLVASLVGTVDADETAVAYAESLAVKE